MTRGSSRSRSGAPKLPPRLTLPSGIVVTLDASGARPAPPRPRTPGAPLFSEALSLLEDGTIALADAHGAKVSVRALSLADFHVLRAILTRSGWLDEEALEVPCRNCEAAVRVRPCATLEIGPFVDGELDDDELDRTLPFGEPHPIEPVALGRVRSAKTVTLAPRTVGETLPLFEALAREPLDVDAAFVRGLGIEALGPERDPARIADALASCEDGAFASVTDVFLASHYPFRLGAVAFCEACGARNDVDAPYERELPAHAAAARHGPPVRPTSHGSFPDLDAFAARAHALAEPLLASVPGAAVALVVDGGTPAVDDGGEPLLGSYVPPHPGDLTTPSRAPTITVYHRTFRAMWEEEGAYDWESELEETIEHELEHHVFFLRGEDPMDEEERAEIREEGLRVVGRREANRRAIEGFGASVGDFTRRTWPIWLLLGLSFALTICADAR